MKQEGIPVQTLTLEEIGRCKKIIKEVRESTKAQAKQDIEDEIVASNAGCRAAGAIWTNK